MLPGAGPGATSTGLGSTLSGMPPRPMRSPAWQRRGWGRASNAGAASSSAALSSARSTRAAARRERGGRHEHYRLGGVDAGDLQAGDGVDALAGGKELAGDGAPGVPKA